MLRYENEGTTISVKLPRTDYTAFLTTKFDKEKDIYSSKLYIMSNDVEDLNLIGEGFEFESNFAKLKTDMANLITDLFEKGFFKYYIDRYEYQQKCFEIGLEDIENANEK